MYKVGDILQRKNRNTISVTPDTSVVTALQLMAEQNVGSVVVLDAQRHYQGIFTERDYSRKVVLQGRSSTDTRVAEIMSTGLPSLKKEDTIEHCMQLMSDQNIRYLPVFEGNTLTGIISMSDVVRETIRKQQDTIEHLEHYIHSNA